MIEKQMIEKHVDGFDIYSVVITAWLLIHKYFVQFIFKDTFQSQFELHFCLCVYLLSYVIYLISTHSILTQ